MFHLRTISTKILLLEEKAGELFYIHETLSAIIEYKASKQLLQAMLEKMGAFAL